MCINPVFHADDLCIVAPCAIALQELIGLCYEYSVDIDLIFNATKSYCVAFTPKLYKLALNKESNEIIGKSTTRSMDDLWHPKLCESEKSFI